MKISIIMPIYNSEKYLEEAITSIFQQKFYDFELICINDCSSDSTKEILDKWTKQDSRMKVITNPVRLGAAVSRNIGITHSSGKYLLFLDSDDIFDEELLANAYDVIETHDADIAVFEYLHVPSEKVFEKRRMNHGERYIIQYCSKTFDMKTRKAYEFVRWHSAAWNKIYRRTFIEKNDLKFQNLESSNDMYFSLMSLLLAEKIIQLNSDKVMVYARDHSGEYRISNNRNLMCTYKALEYVLIQLVKKNRIGTTVNHYFYRVFFTLKNILYYAQSTKETEKFYLYLHNEGIERLRLLAGEYYAGVDENIKKCLDEFIKRPYQSKWYVNDSVFKIYLQDNTEYIKGILQKYVCDGRKIGIWGAGCNGKAFLNFCREEGIVVDAVVDMDKNKQGKTVGGYSIQSPNEIDVDVFFVTGERIAESVQVIMMSMGLKVELWDVNMILGIY